MLPLIAILTFASSIKVDLWVCKEDRVYHPGERLKIYFKTDQDCFVAVYNIEVGGREKLLFPSASSLSSSSIEEDKEGALNSIPDQGGREEKCAWVRAEKVYELPPEGADYEYEVTGPAGIERIVLFASKEELPDLAETNDSFPSEAITRKSIEIMIEEPEPAYLRIISRPKNCKIYITEVLSQEETYIGKTPRTIVIKPGEYIVRIKKFGYRTIARRIRLEPKERRRVFVRLQGDPLWVY